MNDGGRSLQSRIQAHYAELPRAERRLADFLLGQPHEVASYTATELAQLAGTSKAAATRLFRRLGYRDFNAVREEARTARRWGSPLYLDRPRGRRGSTGDPVARQLAQDQANLRATLGALSPQLVDSIAMAIAGAPRVFVIGYRNSRFLAHYLQRQLLLLRDGVALIPAAGQTVAEDLVHLEPEDVVIVIGLRRRAAVLPRVLELVRARGARILMLADPGEVAHHGGATWWLTCHVDGPAQFDSYAAVMSLLNLLCAAIFRLDPQRGYQRLQAIEALHDELVDLVTPDPGPGG
ncbi:MAG TPA: MurR/RpiR family transcriptional regulator [Gammaproteobacteria bacterium]